MMALRSKGLILSRGWMKAPDLSLEENFHRQKTNKQKNSNPRKDIPDQKKKQWKEAKKQHGRLWE